MQQTKTIIITGAAGFIGSHLSEKLLERGDRVIGLDNFNDYYDPQKKHFNIAAAKKQKNFTLIEGDIRDQTLIPRLFQKYQPDTVVHLAARAGVRPSLENPRLYHAVNVEGTLNILEAMKSHHRKHLVFASSSSVYGNRSNGPFKETDNTDFQVSPYGATKKTGELITHVYAHLYGIHTTCLRFFTVYGPRNRPDMACFLFTDAVSKEKPIKQFGDGTTGRDYTFVSDTVQGIAAAIDHPFPYEIINLGNSSPVLLKDLIKTVEDVVGKKAKIETKPMQPGDVNLTFADISKAQKLLGYNPQTNIHDGLKALFSWYQKHQ